MAEMRAATIKPVSSGTRIVKAPSKASFLPGVMCEKCNNRLVELKRQVLRSILPELQGLLKTGKNLNTVRDNSYSVALAVHIDLLFIRMNFPLKNVVNIIVI